MIAPFDALAAEYDRTFTDTPIGRRFRNVTWRRCEALFPPGSRVFEINCGTGEDAVHLGARGVRVLATDASAAMVAMARRKAIGAGVASQVDVACLRIEEVSPSLGTFDGLLSNFGGLNCVADLVDAAGRLAQVVRPGGVALLTIMGPRVPWEWAWFLARGDLTRAFRRLRRGGVAWRDTLVRYPSSGDVRRAFAPAFRATRVAALGAFPPPPFAQDWASRHPRATAWLDRLERRVETVWPLHALADHYILEMERTDA